ncbi:MAG TPA: epoxyalkane--coenzyme M transferase [Hyphomicrobiales bacterium]|nr:epoxyalkane--coenzyme M transferase [Hyphomicrobiales bacterium]
MRRSVGRILTTHCGSLPRPPELVQLYGRRATGETVDEAALAATGRAAMQASIRDQAASGIDVGNNGEQQRENFFLHVQRRMTGFGGVWTRYPRGDVERYSVFRAMLLAQMAGRGGVSPFAPPKAIGAIAYRDPAEAAVEPAEFRAALEALDEPFEEAFLTAPSPGIVAAAVKNEHYPDRDAYLDALGEALRLDYEAIVDAGFILQLDCPDLALERHLSFDTRPLSEFLAFVEAVVAVINRAIRNIPPERVRLHVCWGNYEGPHDRDVPLATIWPLIRRARVGGFVLPFANPRHAHEIGVLRAAPLEPGQILVAGVIDVLTNFVEHPEVVAERIERAAAVLGDPSRVLAGTDCGFDTSAGSGRVASDVVWAKLRALADGARLASERLF